MVTDESPTSKMCDLARFSDRPLTHGDPGVSSFLADYAPTATMKAVQEFLNMPPWPGHFFDWANMARFDTEDLTIAFLKDQLDAAREERDGLRERIDEMETEQPDTEPDDTGIDTLGAQLVLAWALACIFAFVFGVVQLSTGF